MIGAVGLGLMGSAFATNLIRAGFSVRGFDTDPSRMDAHRARGGELADTPAAACAGLRFVLVSVPDGAVSREIALGPGGIAEGAGDNLIVLDATTVSPDAAEALSQDLANRGIRFMDSCVSGTSAMAMRKDLIVIAGGDTADFAAARPVFEGFSRAAHHLGPVGSGARMKLLVAIVLAGNRLGLAEALVLAEKAEMDRRIVLQVLEDSAAASRTMTDKGPKMIDADYSREGQVKGGLKNSRLMLEQAARFGAPAPIASVFAEVMKASYVRGDGNRDTAAFIEVMRVMAGLDPR